MDRQTEIGLSDAHNHSARVTGKPELVRRLPQVSRFSRPGTPPAAALEFGIFLEVEEEGMPVYWVLSTGR